MNESFMGNESELTSSSESKFKLYALSEVIEKCLTLTLITINDFVKGVKMNS